MTNKKAKTTKFQKNEKTFLLFFIRHWCTQPDWISVIEKHFVKTKVFRHDESFCQQTQKNEDATFHLVDETRWDRKILDPWMLRALRGGQSIEFLLPNRGLRYDHFVKKIHFQGHFSKIGFVCFVKIHSNLGLGCHKYFRPLDLRKKSFWKSDQIHDDVRFGELIKT